MGELEAKLYLTELKTGIIKPNLTEEEKAEYIKSEEGKKRDNEICKRRYGNEDSGIWKEFSEKDFLIHEIQVKLNFAELFKKIKYCNENGHSEGSSHMGCGQSGTKVYAVCKRCGMGYDRPLTSKEWEEFNKHMNTPMTI